MKAIFVTAWGNSEVLQIREADRPVPKPTEVLIRSAAMSVNFADIKQRSGPYKSAKTPPFIPGIDTAGTIVAVGSDVTRVRPGQRVVAFPAGGSYAEYVVADERLTFAIPDELGFDTAAACPIVAFTAFNLLTQVAQLQSGESVLIHSAAGGVGSIAVQLAKWLGAGRVIGTVGDDSKAALVQSLGADEVVNYRRRDFTQVVQDVTDGRGVDVILESSGGDMLQRSLDCLAMFGRIAQFGTRGDGDNAMNISDISKKCQSVIGYSFGTNRKHRPDAVKMTAEAILPLIAEGAVRVHIDRKFALQDAAEAHQWIESRRSQGKVLLVPTDSEL